MQGALWMVGALNLISVAFAVLFVGIGVDFGIQFGVRYGQERFIADDDRALPRTGSFMALSPPKGVVLHPVPLRKRGSSEPPPIRILDKSEKQIIARAEEAQGRLEEAASSYEKAIELRPEEGYGAATEAMAALVHHGYLFWEAGEVTQTVQAEQLGRIVASPWTRSLLPSGRPAVRPSYVQLPSFALWGVLEGGAPEPLDGWFAARANSSLLALAVFGIRSGRAGFTTLEVGGAYPGLERREDGTPLFAPLESESGARTGMGAVASGAELLELAWRIEPPG